jgi:hypothetical protein
MRRLAVIAFALTLVACSNNDTPKSSADSSTSSVSTTLTTASGTVDPTVYVESGDYVNGRHIGLIRSVTTSDRSIDIDIVQFLTGDAAIAAYKQDTGASEPPDNDYYVRNQNKLVRHLTLSADAAFRVQTLAAGNVTATSPDQGTPVTLDTFAGYWDTKHEQAINTMFWITLKDSKVVSVEEQFVP